MPEQKPQALIILTPGFPGNEGDSTCVPPLQVFVKALKEVAPRLEVIVLTFQYPFFSKQYDWHGVKVIPFGNKANNGVLNRLAGIRVWATLKQLQKEYNAIGMLSFWLGKCAFWGNKFANKYGLTHYTWLWGQDAKAGNKNVARIKPQGGELIALSDFIVREFERNYGIRPAQVVPVGICPEMFGPVPDGHDIDILGAGSLIPLKQYDVFIEVIGALKDEFPDVKAAICGDGPEMKHLQQMIGAMGLQNNVKLLGRMEHKEVLAAMQRTRIFLHTSNYEGFGVVLLEALYAGARLLSFVRPMDKPIANWYFAADKEDMIRKLKIMLAERNRYYAPVMTYTTHDNARAILKLFNYKEEITA